MKRAKNLLQDLGFHALLLPLFFLVHTYNQYAGLVSASVAFQVGSVLILIVFLLGVLLFGVTGHLNKTLQLVTLYGFVFLFFGVLKDFLQYSLHAGVLSKYSVLLPVLICGTIVLTRIVLTKKDFRVSNLFQNLLLILFVVIDILHLVWYSNMSGTQNLLTENRSVQVGSSNTNERPDVYYLLFDCYPGSEFLRNYMSFDNSQLETMLQKQGLYVVKEPRSNYNRTAFSIASTLNFQYLKGIKPGTRINARDYSKATLTVKQALVPKVFQHEKYSLYNLSVFDIDSTPAIRKEKFLTMPERQIFMYNTLFGRLRIDLLWHFLIGKYSIAPLKKLLLQSEKEKQEDEAQKNAFNHVIFDSLIRITRQMTATPKFVYAHFYMPHPPFFYDENGKANDPKYIFTDASKRDSGLFLSYLKYTNKIIETIFKRIDSSSGGKSVVIIQSDHGFNDYNGGPTSFESYFANFSAFYFPDQNYSSLYDTLSNINTFPIIFNKYFGTQIPMKRDSSIFLSN